MPEMNDELKVVLQEVKEGVVEAVVPAVTKDVMEKIQASIKEIRPVEASQDAKAKEQQKATVEAFRKGVADMESGAKNVTVFKALDSATENSGAEFVPEYFNSEVLRVAEKHGVMRRDARVVPMRGKTEQWPTAGSISVSRVDEKGKIPVVSPTTGSVKLTAKKLAAIIPMTRELLAYSNVAVIDQIAALAGEATARAEDFWGFRGLASGEGIFQNEDVPTHILAPGKNSYADVDFSDLLALQDLIDDHAFVDGNLKYYLRRSVLNALRARLIDESSSNLSQALAAIALPNLMTLPYETVAVLPGTTDPNNEAQQAGEPFMGLYNLQHLLMGSARSYEVEMSREATIGTGEGGTVINLWEQDMVAIRVMESIDFVVSNADKAFATIVTADDAS